MVSISIILLRWLCQKGLLDGRRWFMLKQGKLFWFKDSTVTRVSKPLGVILVATCLTVKGAEDILNRQYAFELSTQSDTSSPIPRRRRRIGSTSSDCPYCSTLDQSPTLRSSIAIASNDDDDNNW
ncbi:hypothetical protein SO802_017111 [Lithocarpus litseifolius]|uniref:Uncharacterized protein n=1 Tax=Lithocarpus litseifolius TaxID=425828 RepID=A0AAW2CYF4_9ROSI